MNIQELPKLIINLPQMDDRLKSIESQLPKLFDNTEYTLIEGVTGSTSAKNIFQAHLKAIRYAKEKEFEYVLILEDDCIFTDYPNIKPYVQEAFNNLPDEWDVLLGSCYGGSITPFNSYWSKTKYACGNTFNIYPKKNYDSILQLMSTGHFDRVLDKRFDKIYVANPYFAYQKTGFSSNKGLVVDYNHLLKGKKLI